ncbi:MAG: hypothetical protein K2N51_11310 [Lachnospiraceae bacterium]|nr:hypothetical protein [Lachnospiraceae bacterium]
MSHEKIKSLFSSAVESVVSSIADYAVNPEKDFTRYKKFPNQQRAKLRPEAFKAVFHKFSSVRYSKDISLCRRLFLSRHAFIAA